MTTPANNINEMSKQLEANEDKFVIAAMYQFLPLEDTNTLREQLQKLCSKNQIFGTILLAREGINGTIAAPKNGMVRFLDWLKFDGRFDNAALKFAFSPKQPFLRMKVRLKKEIVTMGCPDIDPSKHTGTYIDPTDWNDLISDPDVFLVDVRNTYETAIGMFRGAIDPKTKNFREFPIWARSLANKPDDQRPKKIAMYCTGGIRCEKASALMQNIGFEEVYHLKGGILKYLEDVPASESKWLGECFVFDARVAVDHALRPGNYKMCHACRMPLSADDVADPSFVDGISCLHCKPTLKPDQEARFAERQKQIQLAAERGEKHLGSNPHKVKKKPSY